MVRHIFILAIALTLISCSQQNDSQQVDNTSPLEIQSFSVLFGGTKVGAAKVVIEGKDYTVDFEINNNGRGAKKQESLTLNDSGVPLAWTIEGVTTFGNEIDENFSVSDGIASWSAAAGAGSAAFSDDLVYINQDASPYSTYVYAKALLNDADMAMPALPSGTLRLRKLDVMSLAGISQTVEATVYALSGISLDPDYLAIDAQQRLIAIMSPRGTMIRQGFEAEDTRLRDRAAALNADRFEDIASRVTHKYDKPVRIRNVRVFDPLSLSLSAPKSVVVSGEKIIAIDDLGTQGAIDEVAIDGAGGSLIPGLFEMHGHMSDNDALLNVMAGVTSVRDTGNEIDVLDSLIEKIEANTLIGPRITKSGFIEGKSEFSNATGEMAETQEQAVQLVRDFAERGDYFQIKIYSSVKGEWVPAMAAEAHKLGLRVAGHIPAFSNADQMIAAGYDEITHINQVMLGWVLDLDEDTRTLYRITGMKRFVGLDLSSSKVQKTLNAMVDNNIVLDPTLVIHELGLTGRNGETRTGALDYIENMPIGVQRDAKSALLNVADAKEDADYRLAFDKIIETLTLMHQKGILIVPGTDLGGAFELHREMELFQQLGMSTAEVLRRASYDMANYLGRGDDLGSIEVGKLADFFLVPGNPIEDLKAIKTISLVSRGGDFYFPTEVYPEFGIKPFTTMPTVTDSVDKTSD